LPLGKLGKKAKLEAEAKAAGEAGTAAGAGAAGKAKSHNELLAGLQGESVRRRNELLTGLQRVVCEKNLNICPAGATPPPPPGGEKVRVEDLIKKSGSNKRGCVYAHKAGRCRLTL